MSAIITLFIIVPLVGALLLWLLPKAHRTIIDFLAFSVSLVLAALSVYLYFINGLGEVLIWRYWPYLVIDGFSQLLLLTANIIFCLVVIYSISYAKKYEFKYRFYALLFAMLAGINGVLLSGDLLLLFLFMELAAFSAYGLISFGGEKLKLEATLKYFLMGEVASLIILFGIALLYGATHTLNLAELAKALPPQAAIKSFIMALFLAGFGTKAALFPFHSWLPDADVAPSPVSALLSGVIIKTLGVYVIIRLVFNVFGVSVAVAYCFVILGSLSILIGGLLSVTQWDIKRIMAYSSISQIGYLFVAFGLATPFGLMAGIFHLFNHAFMKSLLFLNAGSVEMSTGTRDLRELGGLAKKVPATYFSSLLGSLAISGLPPFNGFWSKFFIIIACVQIGQIWLALIAVAGSLLTLAAYLRIQRYVFWGTEAGPKEVAKAPVLIGLVMVVMALTCLLIGLVFPFVTNLLINPAVAVLIRGTNYSHLLLGGLK